MFMLIMSSTNGDILMIRDNWLGLRLTSEAKERLKELAKKSERSMTAEARFAIMEHLDRAEAERAAE